MAGRLDEGGVCSAVPDKAACMEMLSIPSSRSAWLYLGSVMLDNDVGISVYVKPKELTQTKPKEPLQTKPKELLQANLKEPLQP